MTRAEAIAEITRRLVEYYQPERIYLFGSAARADEGPDSDLDFCVILPDDAPQSLYEPGVRKVLRGVGTAADVVRWPASDFDARGPLSPHRCRRRSCGKGGCCMTPEELLHDEADRWLVQARKDLTAEVLVTVEPSRSLFHSQQAAEKSAKVLLTARNVPFARRTTSRSWAISAFD